MTELMSIGKEVANTILLPVLTLTVIIGLLGGISCTCEWFWKSLRRKFKN